MASRLCWVRGRRRRHFVPWGARRLCVSGGARDPGAISFPGEGAWRQRRPGFFGGVEGIAGGQARPEAAAPGIAAGSLRWGRSGATRGGRRLELGRRAPAGRDSWLGCDSAAGSVPAVAAPAGDPGAACWARDVAVPAEAGRRCVGLRPLGLREPEGERPAAGRVPGSDALAEGLMGSASALPCLFPASRRVIFCGHFSPALADKESVVLKLRLRIFILT